MRWNELDTISYETLLIGTARGLELQVNLLHYASRYLHHFAIYSWIAGEIDKFHPNEESWKNSASVALKDESLMKIKLRILILHTSEKTGSRTCRS